jgi:hypothetical protein
VIEEDRYAEELVQIAKEGARKIGVGDENHLYSWRVCVWR